MAVSFGAFSVVSPAPGCACSVLALLVMEVYNVLDVIDRVINVLSEERDDGDDDAIKMVHSRKLWTTALSRSSLLGPYYLLERSVPHSVTHGQ